MEPVTLSIDAAVDRSGKLVSRTRIYDNIKSGDLPSYKLGNGRRGLKTPEFDAWLESQLRADKPRQVA